MRTLNENTINKSSGKNIRIAVVDSGISINHPVFKNYSINPDSIAISELDNSIVVNHDIDDNFGHGTAVCGIIHKLSPEAELIIIKIFDNAALQADESKLVFALNYIYDKIPCDIIHLSLGTTLPSSELYNCCKKLRQRGTILVSAYDNAGAISYPANYPEVIGVEGDNRCIQVDDFFVLKDDDNITVFAKGGNHRLAWVDTSYIISQGSSFSAAYVTSYIAKMLSCGIIKENIIKTFKENAKRYLEIPKTNTPNLTQIPFEIHNAILFPYNKEMHSLVNYADNLPFIINDICDTKYTGRIGKYVHSLNGKNEFKIKSINQIDWDKIDTLILGHLNELDSMVGKSVKKDLIDICLNHNINIYSLDDLILTDSELENERKDIMIYTPNIISIDYLKKYCGKMFQYQTPIIEIMGTSSSQGKFTLQLALRYAFEKSGYSIAQIGTEPTALLFGMDACYPFGYNSNIHLSELDSILAINHLLHHVECKRPDADLILIGSQSGSVPMLFNNIHQMTLPQIAFLMGSMPDAVILCVNPDDSPEYIQRTIRAIEGVGATKVIALALYPLAFSNGWQIMNGSKKLINNPTETAREIYESTKLPVFIMGDEEEVNKLSKLCIEYLAED